MKLFKKKEEVDEKEILSQEILKKKLKDLKPENKRQRKEPAKPWGKKERLYILITLILTVLISIIFSLSSGNFTFPKFPDFNLNETFKGETIILGKKEDVLKALQDKKAEEIVSKFRDMTNVLKGSYVFEVIFLEDDYRFGVGKDDVMQAASLIKLPLMLYAQGKVDDSKLEAMGKRSDNNVFRELIAKFSKRNVQDYITNGLKMEKTFIEENLTTSDEIGSLFFRLYRDKEERILSYLTDTNFEEWIKKGVPENIRVAHKYGREEGVVNDAGIIYGQKPFVLVIMSKEVNIEEANREIPNIVNMIYSKICEN